MSDQKEFIPWSEELSVGLQEIDEQHKILGSPEIQMIFYGA